MSCDDYEENKFQSDRRWAQRYLHHSLKQLGLTREEAQKL